MALCPIALVVGCKSCPLVTVCPGKSIIGDYKVDQPNEKKDEEKRKKPK